jgi:hypothetical protein
VVNDDHQGTMAEISMVVERLLPGTHALSVRSRRRPAGYRL